MGNIRKKLYKHEWVFLWCSVSGNKEKLDMNKIKQEKQTIDECLGTEFLYVNQRAKI